jgi:hypothetical protein
MLFCMDVKLGPPPLSLSNAVVFNLYIMMPPQLSKDSIMIPS